MMLQYNTIIVLLGTSVLGCVGGIIGCFLLLKKQALISDTISHATLPGVGLAFIVTEFAGYGKSLPSLLLGAFITSLLAILALSFIRRISNIQEDAGLAIILAVFFGLGIVVLSLVQRLPGGSSAGLNSFIYGKTASMLASDALLISGISLGLLIVIMLIYKELTLLCFDREWAKTQGFPIYALDITLSILSLLLIIAGLQAVGLILIVSVLLIPPTAARFWTKRISQMTLLAAIFGLFSSMLGTLVSSSIPDAPAGAVIVMAMGLLFLFSMIFGTQTGLLVMTLQQHHVKNSIIRERLFLNCYYALQPITVEQILSYADVFEQTEKEAAQSNKHPNNIFKQQRFFEIEHYQIFRSHGWATWQIARCLKRTRKDGYIQKIDTDMYTLSKSGIAMMVRVARLHERKHQVLRYRPASITPLDISSSEAIDAMIYPELRQQIDMKLQKTFPVLFDKKLDALAGERK